MADPPDKPTIQVDATGEKQLAANKDKDRYVLPSTATKQKD
jgi:hypothetical protein